MTRKKRVLFMEDDLSVLEAGKRLLDAMGYEVDTATTYVCGRAMLDAHTYNLIISDNQMPIHQGRRPYKTAGIELLALAYFQDKHEGVPLLLYTGDDSDKTKADLASFGGHYLYKPSHEFADVVRKLLNE